MPHAGPQAGDAPPERYRIVVLLMLLVVYCFSYIDRQIIGILALPIKAELQLNDTQLGLMGGFAFAIFYSVLGVPIARLADRFNRVWIITAALTMWSGFTALCGMATGFWQLFLARIGVGVGEAGGVAPSFAIISDYFPPHQRARALAVLTLALPIGSATGLYLGGLLASLYGWRTAFVVIGVAGIAFAPLLLLVVREPRRGAMEAQPIGDAPVPTMREVLAKLTGKPSFWWLSLGAAIASMLSYGLGFWLPAFLNRSKGMSLLETSQSLSAITIVGGVLGILAGGWLGDWLGGRDRRAYAILPGIAFAIGMPFLLLGISVESVPLMLALLLVPQAMGLVWTGPSVAAIQHLAPASMRATASSIYLLIVNFVGLGLGTLLFGMVSHGLAGSYGQESLRYSILFCAVLLYPLAVLFHWLAARRLREDWEAP